MISGGGVSAAADCEGRCERLRLVSFNVNSLPAILSRKGFQRKDLAAFLDSWHNEASILCFQECKMTRSDVDGHYGKPTRWHAFLSLADKSVSPNGGYSGVGTFTRIGKATPLDAWEGLTAAAVDQRCKRRRLDSAAGHSHSSSTRDESPSSRFARVADEMRDAGISFDEALAHLEKEGRCVVTDHGTFVLFNLYGPTPRPDEQRMEQKQVFNVCLEYCVGELVRAGRQVVVCGDLNITASKLDAHEPAEWDKLQEEKVKVWPYAGASWLNSFMDRCGLVDVFRHFHPTREKAYTCWDQSKGARLTNYGARPDHIIASSSLLPLISGCDIHPDIHGSDHCPISATFAIPTVPPHPPGPPTDPPPFCACNWQEARSRQANIFAFAKAKPAPAAAKELPQKRTAEGAGLNGQSQDESIDLTQDGPSGEGGGSAASVRVKKAAAPAAPPPVLRQRDLRSMLTGGKAGQGQAKTKQGGSGGSFWGLKQGKSQVKLGNVSYLSKKEQRDYEAMAPYAPVCQKHGEAMIQRRVLKEGANKGRLFWVCARPSGDETHPASRCNTFYWNDDVRGGGGGGGGSSKKVGR
ncbi:unnamed protein product [Vitrella brassicaformis CCMP3155]|uniref:DNA-(apurinic or apyrimidinic site) endonuclease n=1 Tax=Vitrella brassicaformis (strain CCMP3155) TaxID=1169540 RepID=A0A0G4G6Z1_VITBC|nr:unnamed protein product [Vitrella brassicaformis CCMP3155]|eukprot:CEM24385.1 unnamed protein product [Vitrella brassicaformis CCMP3155]